LGPLAVSLFVEGNRVGGALGVSAALIIASAVLFESTHWLSVRASSREMTDSA
jgi:hypothetical protein